MIFKIFNAIYHLLIVALATPFAIILNLVCLIVNLFSSSDEIHLHMDDIKYTFFCIIEDIIEIPTFIKDKLSK